MHLEMLTKVTNKSMKNLGQRMLKVLQNKKREKKHKGAASECF